MHQLVFIHGGETFETYDAYLAALRSWDYEPDDEGVREKRWKETLKPELGENWQVLMPGMPSKNNAKYCEWKIWFEKVIPFIHDGVVLVGHSLGAIFLAKYLSEERMPITVRATFLIAAPYSEESESGSLADFILPESLQKLQEQGGKLFLYQSEDDPVVPISELHAYEVQLPDAEVRVFTDRGHFLSPEFPELIQDIQSLVNA